MTTMIQPADLTTPGETTGEIRHDDANGETQTLDALVQTRDLCGVLTRVICCLEVSPGDRVLKEVVVALAKISMKAAYTAPECQDVLWHKAQRKLYRLMGYPLPRPSRDALKAATDCWVGRNWVGDQKEEVSE